LFGKLASSAAKNNVQTIVENLTKKKEKANKDKVDAMLKHHENVIQEHRQQIGIQLPLPQNTPDETIGSEHCLDWRLNTETV